MVPRSRGTHRREVLSKLVPPRAQRPPTAGREARARVAWAILVAAVVLTLTTPSAIGATTYAASCDGVNLRSNAGTTYPIKKSVSAGTQVSVVTTVSGGSWSATCAGKAVSGSSWYRINAVNGTSVSTLYGVTYVYGATGLFKAVAAPPPSPTAQPDPSGSPGSSDPPGPTPLPDAVTFYGRGYGHGVGFSQYGAYGRASAGQDYQTILAHYYQGTTLGTTTNAQVRVLVLSGFVTTSTVPLRLYGRGGTWTFDGIAKTFPADAMARLIPTGTSGAMTWRLVVTSSTGSVLYDAATGGNLKMRPAETATVLQLYSKPTSYDRYRGVLHLRGSTTSASTSVVNELPLETYLRGTVPVEMPSTWPQAALLAQTVASRSYAVRRLHPTTGIYDLYDDTRSQVYRGSLAERSATNATITATALMVLKSGTSVANALYHSCGGGATEDNEDSFVSASGAITSSPVSYLRGSSDRAPDGTAYDKASPYATWHTATYSLAQVQAFFAADSRTNVGTLVAIDLTHRGVSGRLVSVTLIGLDGTTKTVSGGVFVSVFNAHRPVGDAPMRDALFDLSPIP